MSQKLSILPTVTLYDCFVEVWRNVGVNKKKSEIPDNFSCHYQNPSNKRKKYDGLEIDLLLRLLCAQIFVTDMVHPKPPGPRRNPRCEFFGSAVDKKVSYFPQKMLPKNLKKLYSFFVYPIFRVVIVNTQKSDLGYPNFRYSHNHYQFAYN